MYNCIIRLCMYFMCWLFICQKLMSLTYDVLCFVCHQIHQRLVEQSTWDNKVKAISWRVDVKTKSKETEQLNQASAIVEMQLGTDQNTNVSKFQFVFNMVIIRTYVYSLMRLYALSWIAKSLLNYLLK